MLTVTERAGAFLDEMLQGVDAAEDITVRIVFGFRGLEFQISAECPNDSAFQFHGKTVLVVDAHLSEALAEKILDTRQIDGTWALDLH